jgi:hypothetical protein
LLAGRFTNHQGATDAQQWRGAFGGHCWWSKPPGGNEIKLTTKIAPGVLRITQPTTNPIYPPNP